MSGAVRRERAALEDREEAARETGRPAAVAQPAPGRGLTPQLARALAPVVGNQAIQRALTPAARPVLQRKLIATGSDVAQFIALVEPAIGLQLSHDPATNEITAIGSLVTPGTSPQLESILTMVMDHPTQNAEVNFGRGQHRVAIGAFPNPSDLTGSTVQRIDIDDIENIEAGAPGHGLAQLAHEITENFAAHAHVPVAGTDLFPDAHRQGTAAESAVAGDLVAVGADKVAARAAPGPSANVTIQVRDFTTHFLVWTQTRTITGGVADFAVSNARTAQRVNVNIHTIDGFANNGDAMPATGAAFVAAALADLTAHPQATAHIRGFADSNGTPAVNNPLSQRRAQNVAAALTAGGGIGGGSLHVVGRGATDFVAGNATEADRARNRRVEIVVDEPAP
jgi:outer membrane protein OmpA-like peptidoglycan-associated protein